MKLKFIGLLAAANIAANSACTGAFKAAPSNSNNSASVGQTTQTQTQTKTTSNPPPPSGGPAVVTNSQLQGSWKSQCVYDSASDSYLISTATFGSNVQFLSHSYSDSACSSLLANVDASADYHLGALSSLVTDATVITLANMRISVTPANSLAAVGMNLQGFCNYSNWSSGTSHVIPSNEPCLVDLAPSSPNLVRVDGNTMYFGNNAGTALSNSPWAKQ